jgi:hypothetical protein
MIGNLVTICAILYATGVLRLEIVRAVLKKQRVQRSPRKGPGHPKCRTRRNTMWTSVVSRSRFVQVAMCVRFGSSPQQPPNPYYVPAVFLSSDLFLLLFSQICVGSVPADYAPSLMMSTVHVALCASVCIGCGDFEGACCS